MSSLSIVKPILIFFLLCFSCFIEILHHSDSGTNDLGTTFLKTQSLSEVPKRQKDLGKRRKPVNEDIKHRYTEDTLNVT